MSFCVWPFSKKAYVKMFHFSRGQCLQLFVKQCKCIMVYVSNSPCMCVGNVGKSTDWNSKEFCTLVL